MAKRENKTRRKYEGTVVTIFVRYILGMSFGVRFKVRTFGYKHPDGSNVRIYFVSGQYYMYIYMYVLERTFIIKSH